MFKNKALNIKLISINKKLISTIDNKRLPIYHNNILINTLPLTIDVYGNLLSISSSNNILFLPLPRSITFLPLSNINKPLNPSLRSNPFKKFFNFLKKKKFYCLTLLRFVKLCSFFLPLFLLISLSRVFFLKRKEKKRKEKKRKEAKRRKFIKYLQKNRAEKLINL